MRFCDRERVAGLLEGKSVAIVGSGPGSLDNPRGLVDSYDVVVRVNNYKLFPATGFRTDVFYSFFGQSIKKTVRELKRDGVDLCMCKCPDAKFMESKWHIEQGKPAGVDFRMIYERRKDWWFCDTYVPSVDEFMGHFNLLGGHVPTTGFSAVLDVLSYSPANVYLTGFDFFSSGLHNVNERWTKLNHSDPIGHVPRQERDWLAENFDKYPITMDARLSQTIR
jgi:hypothetical protein